MKSKCKTCAYWIHIHNGWGRCDNTVLGLYVMGFADETNGNGFGCVLHSRTRKTESEQFAEEANVRPDGEKTC